MSYNEEMFEGFKSKIKTSPFLFTSWVFAGITLVAFAIGMFLILGCVFGGGVAGSFSDFICTFLVKGADSWFLVLSSISILSAVVAFLRKEGRFGPVVIICIMGAFLAYALYFS